MSYAPPVKHFWLRHCVRCTFMRCRAARADEIDTRRSTSVFDTNRGCDYCKSGFLISETLTKIDFGRGFAPDRAGGPHPSRCSPRGVGRNFRVGEHNGEHGSTSLWESGGGAPSGVYRDSAPGQGIRGRTPLKGANPLEAERFSLLDVQ